MKNNTFQEISAVLLAAKKLLLYPHIHMDGDALGSCAALCKALRRAGKEAYILIEEEIPLNLRFLDRHTGTKLTGVSTDAPAITVFTHGWGGDGFLK